MNEEKDDDDLLEKELSSISNSLQVTKLLSTTEDFQAACNKAQKTSKKA